MAMDTASGAGRTTSHDHGLDRDQDRNGDRVGRATAPRRVTLADVARKANVALSSASKAINGTGRLSAQTRRRVLAAA